MSKLFQCNSLPLGPILFRAKWLLWYLNEWVRAPTYQWLANSLIKLEVRASFIKHSHCILKRWKLRQEANHILHHMDRFVAMKICPIINNISQRGSNGKLLLNKPSKDCQRDLKFCQSGEISPNLVTLIVSFISPFASSITTFFLPYHVDRTLCDQIIFGHVLQWKFAQMAYKICPNGI